MRIVGALLGLFGLGGLVYSCFSAYDAAVYLLFVRTSDPTQEILAVLSLVVPLGLALYCVGVLWGGLRLVRDRADVWPILPYLTGVLGVMSLVFGGLMLEGYCRYHSAVAPLRSELWAAILGLVVGAILVALVMAMVRHHRRLNSV